MNAARAILGAAALAGAALGAALDLWSLAMWLKRNNSGTGTSGVGGAAWLLYFAYAVSRRSVAILGALTAFHFACQWLIPALHRRFCAGNRRE